MIPARGPKRTPVVGAANVSPFFVYEKLFSKKGVSLILISAITTKIPNFNGFALLILEIQSRGAI